jgi:hypothetical protein
MEGRNLDAVPWLFVLNNRPALDWVLEYGRMAFKESVSTSKLKSGEQVAVYATRQALPRVDSGQIVAVGEVVSSVEVRPVDVAGVEYAKSCAVEFAPGPPPGNGAPLAPLVDRLRFIVYKDGWAGYLRRSIVEIKYEDLVLLKDELRRADEAHRAGSP